MNSAIVRALGIEWIAPIVIVTFVAGSVAADAPPLPPAVDAPETREFDWIQTASGEWLKGEFDRLFDDKLYFDSDEFGEVIIEWGNVESLLPVNVVTVRLLRRKIVTGTLVMRNGEIRIDAESGVVAVQRDEVVGIISDSGEELGYWSGKASIGLSARAGNTEQTDVTIKGEFRRQTSLTRFKTSYTGQISSVDGGATANSHRVPASFDFFLTERVFLTVPFFEYFSDEFQNIGTRISVGASMGYELIDNAVLSWDVGAGAAFQYTAFDSVALGDSAAEDIAVVANTSLNLDLPRGVEWDNSYKIQIVATDLDKTNHHLESILSFDIWGPLELDLTFIFDRVEKPVENSGGIVPKSNDYRLTMGLAVNF